MTTFCSKKQTYPVRVLIKIMKNAVNFQLLLNNHNLCQLKKGTKEFEKSTLWTNNNLRKN